MPQAQTKALGAWAPIARGILERARRARGANVALKRACMNNVVFFKCFETCASFSNS